MVRTRPSGFHLRLLSSYTDLIDDALGLGLQTFQFLPLNESSGRYIFPAPQDTRAWGEKRAHVDTIYLHSSFKINLCSKISRTQRLSLHFFAKEIEIATQLGVTALVLHPGHKDKRDAFPDALHRFTDTLCSFARTAPHLMFLIENTAHSSTAIGSDLANFSLLARACTNYPNIGFCLDTAHAYAFGYDLSNTNVFVEILSKTMSPSHIKLIHCNDTMQPRGSRIDEHAFPGRGTIGSATLRSLVNHQTLAHIPLIIELSSRDFKKRTELTRQLFDW